MSQTFTLKEVKERAIHPFAWYTWVPEDLFNYLPYNTPLLIAFLGVHGTQGSGYIVIDKENNIVFNGSNFVITETEECKIIPFLGAEKLPPPNKVA